MTALSKIRSLTRIVLLLGMLFTEYALAAEPPNPVSPIGSPQLINLGSGLFVVILAVVIAGVLYARSQGLRGGQKGVIQIVASQAVGPKERLAVVEVADKQLLIGMTATSVQTLHVFDEPVASAPAEKSKFADRLLAAMRGDDK